MKKVYIIMIDIWDEGYCSIQVPYICETLNGVKERFREVTWNQTRDFVFNQTGITSVDDKVLKDNGFIIQECEDADGMLHYSVSYKYAKVYVHIWEKPLLP